jgi:hypothetical protein
MDTRSPDESGAELNEADQEQQLARLHAELEEYQHLIDAFPGIYEAKFSHQLRDVAQDIRNLMEERHRLQQQINHCLLADGESSLPAALVKSDHPESSSVWSLVGWQFWRLWTRKRRLVAGARALALAVFAGLLLRGVNQPSPRQDATSPQTPAAPPPVKSQPPQAPPDDPQLQLRANDDVWLELRSPDNSLVFVSTLKPGKQLTFPFQDGMRLRSGRPHQLEVALNGQPFKPLGIANDFSWRTLRLPERPRGADPETRTSDQPS